MKIRLIGHSYRYAAEQILLQTLDGERPEFTEDAIPRGENGAVIRLFEGDGSARATARLAYNGERHFGAAQTRLPEQGNGLARDRDLQRIIKLAFYRAAAKATRRELPWGATTGIRPSTLITRRVREGVTLDEAEKRLKRIYYVTAERAALARGAAIAELDARKTLAPQAIALYLGIPFCPTRCAYCSFVSQSVEKSLALLPPFLDALHREIDALAAALDGTGAEIVAVYIGGGTPTTLSAEQLDAVLAHLNAAFDLSRNREFTVEAGRPDTITAEKLAAMKARGVTRVSVNPQTMRDGVLRAIGRNHTTEDTYRAMELARAAGFDVINMDLIAGLTDDDSAGFRDSLERVIALTPENITVHTLSLKRGSNLTLAGADIQGGLVSEMLNFAYGALRESGYAPYYLYRQKFTSGGFENTGWTKPDGENLYNIIMMDELRPVLALGGGVNKLIAPTGRIKRLFNPKYPYEYIERIGDIIDRKLEIREFLGGLYNGT
ncbi:MAG: coproporphyrinogen dehydrogenase HemZ [Oscillospiraceae bacterium]|jgi:oxygen-independent coproporphyrinogen-3 oxidase|nr:coproporphyrinogen dehydrogenase HemZ [Oscillospiraceae bacterium]